MRDAKAVITSFVLLVLALSLTIGVAPVQAITWGTEDTSDIYSNVGTIVYYHSIHEDYFLLCSGTLIYEGDGNSNGAVFLTAAHCTDLLLWALDEGIIEDIEDVYVSFDPLDPVSDTGYTVTEIYSHPEYNPITNRPDVGVLILNGYVDITPATLPEEGFLDDLRRERQLRPSGSTGAYFTVAGYGGVLTWPPPAITYLDTRSYARSQFQALLKTQLLLSQNNAKTGEGGTCYGDSGGPVFWEPTTPGEGTLVAVTSWGDAMCVAAGFYYRIDTAEALDFIDLYVP